MHPQNIDRDRALRRLTVRSPFRQPTQTSAQAAGACPLITAIILLLLTAVVSGCVGYKAPQSQVVRTPTCNRVITADVVALDQVYYYNRFGAFNPAGIMYALRRDVVENFDNEEVEILNEDLDTPRAETETFIPLKPDREKDLKLAGHVKLRSDKRPRPLVLRANEGDCLHVTFTNLLSPEVNEHEFMVDPERRLTHPETPVLASAESDEPATRHASMHVNGLSLVDSIDSQGGNVGRNGWHVTDASGHARKTAGRCSSGEMDRGQDLCALAAPGETRQYTWYAKKEGTYFMYSMAAPAGGEGDGGQTGLGLFGAVNVQPTGAKWYRSQVTHEELEAATKGRTAYQQPILDYEAVYADGPRKDNPILNMLKSSKDHPEEFEIVHTDLNAVIDIDREKGCGQMGEGNACGKPYREFTVIFHDELTAVQAFGDITDEGSPLHSLRDGMGINYGSSGLGALVVANREKIGPARDCAECKLEEFFLTSWVNGDPALVVGYKKANGELVPVVDKKTGEQREIVVTHNGRKDRRLLWQMEAKYPDDPSNVHHSYLGDPVRFRNMHAGPKETHVFHLHAHQWVEDKHDPLSHYLDSQTISPGSAFSYEVHYGGSGNRNLGPGDSIFHCHLYPHFAEGMWELWRTHDVLEDGGWTRNLPDYDIEEGVPTPAIVPLPRTAMPPMPTKDFKGYPHYIAAQKGHRPPQPPLDLEVADSPAQATTLRRHILLNGQVLDGKEAHGPDQMKHAPGGVNDLYDQGRAHSAQIADRVAMQNSDPDLLLLARELESVEVAQRDDSGTSPEKEAMRFHGGESKVNGKPAVKPGDPGWHPTSYNWEAPGYRTCLPDGTCDDEQGARVLFRVNGGGNVGNDSLTKTRKPGDGVPGAPFSNPCPKEWVDEHGKVRPVKIRQYRTVYLQMDMTVNKAGWHDPQARFPVLEEDAKSTLDGTRPTEPLFFRAQSGECIEFIATNLIPSNLNQDDFQVYTPTDTIGQHIHLVKFDVTSSDGSGNGWNYEDGTFAADEVRERIVAHNRRKIRALKPGEVPKLLEPATHRLFLTGALKNDPRGICPPSPMTQKPGETNEAWIVRWDRWAEATSREHPWCGAQTTIQRWWADPILNGTPGARKTQDRTMRTVFTHDHFGPSSHQHHGFYAALVVEPSNSKWYFPDGRLMGGTDAVGNPKLVDGRQDGGPTSYAANIIVRDVGKACVTPKKDGITCSDSLDAKGTIDRKRTGREFNLAFADFAIVYDKGNQPINPPSQREGGLEHPTLPGFIPTPEGISTKDPGTQLINYRNEPIPLRIGEQDKDRHEFHQLAESDPRGDLANVFSSRVHQTQHTVTNRIFTETEDDGRHKGDPATPLLRAYEGDRVQIRLIQGSQEEQHVFTLHGAKWLAQPDSKNTGSVGAQTIGISEHFEFNDRVVEVMPYANRFENGDEPPQFDHLYASNAADNFWDGQWGLMRVFNRQDTTPRNLARLPGNTEITHDVLASAFVQESLDEQLDSERFEVHDDEAFTHAQADSVQHGASRDALEAFCRRNEQHLVQYEVEAWLAKDLLPGGQLVYNQHFGIADPNAILFVETADVPHVRSRSRRPEPLILRARAGDCIRVTLHNRIKPEHLQDGPEHPETWSYNMVPPIVPGFSFNQVRSSHRVSLHPQLVDYNLQTSDGANVGLNEDSTVAPDEKKTYLWYAGELASRSKKGRVVGIPYEFGAIPLQDMGDVVKHASHGAIGALIVEPQCSRWELTESTSKASAKVTYWDAEPAPGRHGKASKHKVCPASEPAGDSRRLYHFKEMVLLYQDNLSLQQNGQPMPNLRNGDDSEDSGQKAFNYRTEPLWARLGASPADTPETTNQFDWSNVLSSNVSHFRCNADFANGKFCDPETPVFTATAGEKIRFRVVHPGGHPRQHGFTVFGHDWSLYPWQDDSRTMGWNQHNQARVGSAGGVGPERALNIMTSAGGDCAVPGDYLYRTQEGFMFGGGLWGLVRVEPVPDHWYYYFDWAKARWEPDMVQPESGSSRTPCKLQEQASKQR